MKTNFSAAQLEDPRLQEADKILRACVHCGFCTATCPTYVITGDERDSPRGRIYMIQEMLEKGGPPAPETVHHVDRCLSCLACMTTCPSGVYYAHLVDQARAHIEAHHKRPLKERALRFLLAQVLPYPARLRLALKLAPLAKPFGKWSGLAPMLALAPPSLPPAQKHKGTHKAENKKLRVALLTGCAQSVLDPEINAATIRLLTRLGVEVIVPESQGCCGALSHHLGREDEARRMARANAHLWRAAQVDHIIINTSGCGTVIKDYGHLIGDEETAAKALDVSELLAKLDLPQAEPKNIRVAYHSACSLQHGQKIKTAPQELLTRAGFTLAPIAEGHICCGSAGTYNLLQPEMARELQARKQRNILLGKPDIIAASNIGCLTQIAQGLERVPVVHMIELMDWAYGGPMPEKLKGMRP